MKVKELMKVLQKADPEKEIVMSMDAEGNGYSMGADVDTTMIFVPDSPGYGRGEIYEKELTPELKKQGYTEEDIYDYGQYRAH